MELTKRQQKIIAAAIELIAENGIQELTIKNLSKKIGTVESAVYRHFASKMDILLGILEQFKANKTLALEQIQTSGTSEIEQLEMVFSERFRQFTANPAITAVIFSEEIFQNDKRLADKVFAIMESSQKTILTIIEKGQLSGMIRDDTPAEQISCTLIGTLRFIVTKWHLSGFAFDLEAEGVKLWDAIKLMIQK